jgi:hypothetical protein
MLHSSESPTTSWTCRNHYATLNDDMVSGNGNRALYIQQYKHYATLGRNVITGNANAGVRIDIYNDYVKLEGNTIGDSAGGGLWVSSYGNGYWTLSSNTIADNVDDGIYFYGGVGQQWDNNILARNGGDGLLVLLDSRYAQ